MRKLIQLILSFTRVALVPEVSGGTTRDLQALPGHLAALPGHLAALPGNLRVLPGHLAALPRHPWVWPGHLWAWPGHLRAFVASAGLTQAFENYGRTSRTADLWSGLWSGLAAWDHCQQSRHMSLLSHICPLSFSQTLALTTEEAGISNNHCFL